MAYDGVSEATVVGVPHERWQERPVAFVVAADGVDREALVEEIEAGLREDYPKWWVPDAVEFIDEVPKTATGKFSKKDLREQYADQSLVEGPFRKTTRPNRSRSLTGRPRVVYSPSRSPMTHFVRVALPTGAVGVRVDHVALGVEPADFLILRLREREDERIS